MTLQPFVAISRLRATLNIHQFTNSLRRILVKSDAFSQLLVILLSAVLLAPIILIPHGGSFLGLRVFVIQAAAFSALALLMTRTAIMGGSIKSILTRGPGLPLLLLLAWATLSFLITAPANAHARSIAQVELLRIGTGVMVYFVAIYGCRSRFQLRTISRVLMGGAILAASSAIVTCLPSFLKPARGAFGEEQLMGAFLATLLPVAAAFALKDVFSVKENMTGRLVKATGVLIVLCALLLTGERMSWISGTLGTCTAIGLAFWTRMIKIPTMERGVAKSHSWFAPVLIMIAVIGVNVMFMSYVPVVHHRLEIAMTKASIHERFKLWSACEDMIRERPLAGWGIGSFPLQASNYISHIPTAAQVEQQGVTLSSIAHNEYLQMGAELGLVGLGLYLAVIIGFFFSGIQALKRTISGTRRWLLLATLAGVASQSLNALSNPGWHFSDISPLLWLLMGMGMAAATPRVLKETREVHFITKLSNLPYQSRGLGQILVAMGLGISLIWASISVSLGNNIALAYYYYGYPPVISNVTASPSALPVEGGTLTGSATITDGGSGVSNVYAYLNEDGNQMTYQYLGSGASTYSNSFNIPSNSNAATAHIWTILFLAENNQYGYATASASATQPAAIAGTLNVPSQYPNIQAAVNAAQSGDTVLVANGTYSGPGNRDIDFDGKSLTVKSVHGATKTIIDCGGYASTDGSGNHRAFYIHRGERNATISGFTIKNGYQTFIPFVPGSSFYGSGYGGGIYIYNYDGATIAVIDCTLSSNHASEQGGGIYNSNGPKSSSGTVTLTNCNVTDNTAGDGGGVYSFNTNGTIMFTNCNVTGNNGNYGGGVFNGNYGNGNAITLTNCNITGNTGNYGGGVFNDNYGDGDTITLNDCTISGNTAKDIYESFTVNGIHSGEGAGVFNYNYYNNSNGSSTINVTNCTLSTNIAQMDNGGSIFNDNDNYNGTITLINDILYGDQGGETKDNASAVSASQVSYSDIHGGYAGTGNINKNPLFANAATGDLHLKSGSPCLGKGSPSGAPGTDKDGRPRPNPPSIGAYELAATLTISPQYPTIQSAITAARNGDTVMVTDGTYAGPGNVDWDFGGKNITVSSMNGAASAIIDCGGHASKDGSGNHRAFYVHSGETNAVISGLTIKNGYEAFVSGVTDSGYGGSICVDGSSVSIQKCVFVGGTATIGGGGVAAIGRKHHSITFTNCVFTKNTAPDGGGVYNSTDGGAVTLTNCTTTGNTAQQGGGIFNRNQTGSGTIGLTSCSVSDNTAQTGGGVYNENDMGADTITMINCSVSGNDSPIGGAVYNENYAGSTITLINDIAYNDTGGEIDDNALNATATQVSYSDIQGGYPGIGNINKDPLFINFAAGDLHIKSNSPCRGAGTPDGAPATDLDGLLRPNPPSMGAYDFPAPTVHFHADNFTGDADGIVCDNLSGMSDAMKDKLTLSLPDFPDATNLKGTVTADGPNTNDTGEVRTIGNTLYYFPPDEYNENQTPQDVTKDITKPATRTVMLTLQFTSGGIQRIIKKPIILARPPVVLVHGINSNPSAWLPFIKAYEDAGVQIPFVTVNHCDPSTYEGRAFSSRVLLPYPHKRNYRDYSLLRDGPYSPGQGWLSNGNAPAEVGAVLLSERIQKTLTEVHSGLPITDADMNDDVDTINTFSYVNPVATSGAIPKLAGKRLDIVAWSYGGVITRWYLGSTATSSQVPAPSLGWYKSPGATVNTFSDLIAGTITENYKTDTPSTPYHGDVRKVITLGSMWRGVPLCNYLNEIHGPPDNGIDFGNAPNTYLPSQIDNLRHLEDNFLSIIIPTHVPSMEVLAIHSPWLTRMTLDNPPFLTGIAYGSVAGDNDFYKHILPYDFLDKAQSPTWFPYLALERHFDQYGVDSTPNYSDGVVPVWSTAIPGSYKIAPTQHDNYAKDPDTQNYVVQWLNNAALPLGSTLNGLWDTSVTSLDGKKTWTFHAGEMGPHVQNDLYPQIGGVGRIDPIALREINTATYTSLGSTSVTISWLTATDMDSEVKIYTQNSGSAQPVIDRHILTPVKEHQILISGLHPNTTYYYEVVSSLFNAPDPDVYVSSNPTEDPSNRLTFRTVASAEPLIKFSVPGHNSPNLLTFPVAVSNTGSAAHGFTILGVNFSVSGYSVAPPLPASIYVDSGQTQQLMINYKAGVAASHLLCRVNYQYGDDNGNTITGNSAWLRVY